MFRRPIPHGGWAFSFS